MLNIFLSFKDRVSIRIIYKLQILCVLYRHTTSLVNYFSLLALTIRKYILMSKSVCINSIIFSLICVKYVFFMEFNFKQFQIKFFKRKSSVMHGVITKIYILICMLFNICLIKCNLVYNYMTMLCLVILLIQFYM